MVMATAILGAAAGAAAGFLFFTEGGRRLRRDLEPEFDNLVREVGRLRGAVDQIRQGLAGLRREGGALRPRRTA
jgi:hypothetical protein